jgi:hypothetical protein
MSVMHRDVCFARTAPKLRAAPARNGAAAMAFRPGSTELAIRTLESVGLVQECLSNLLELACDVRIGDTLCHPQAPLGLPSKKARVVVPHLNISHLSRGSLPRQLVPAVI